MKLSQVLNYLMDKANVSAYKISKDTGISDRLIGYWKNGDKLPSAENLLIIANYFDISVDYLLTGKEKSPSPELTEEEHKCLEVFNRLEPEDRIRFIAKMEQRYEDYSSEFSEELTSEVKENVS